MRFTVLYASVLLVASLNCIWATPIAVDRNTLQRRSDSGLNTRATEISSVEARSLDINGLSARADEAGSASKEGESSAPKPLVPQTISFFNFMTPVEPSKLQLMTERAGRAIERANPGIKVTLKPSVRAKAARNRYRKDDVVATYTMNKVAYKVYLIGGMKEGSGPGDDESKDEVERAIGGGKYEKIYPVS
ncbi:hypothetical protein BDP27DRAFT_1484098 [Rhodocollybia butyracea]|uniref:Uncharacterized protein n=1 Tax=Rhodocollybia butyracea TaxID=206335 RepID=A0A9P5PGB6_9AGAR|nr:hypothetical protein BDP27DRAFT_1484098 [Rhodocollybia butyracea]